MRQDTTAVLEENEKGRKRWVNEDGSPVRHVQPDERSPYPKDEALKAKAQEIRRSIGKQAQGKSRDAQV